MRKTLLQRLYIYCISAALILHVFNNIEIGGGLKLFHLPAAIAFVIAFFLPKKHDKIHKLIWGFIAISFVGSFLSAWEGSLMKAVTLLIIVGASMGIRSIDSDHLIKWINIGVPFAIIPLVRHYFTDSWYRYQGFYEDPNYMCTTLVVFLFFILLAYKRWSNKFIKAGLITEILLILFLVSTTLSRTGLACTGILLLAAFWDFFRTYRFQSLFALAVMAFLLLHYSPDLINNAISGFMSREDNVDTFQSATALRQEISLRGIRFIFSHPLYLFQGIGVYASGHHECFEGFVAHSSHMDHNTITSSLTEQGIIGFTIFISLLWAIFKNLWHMPRGSQEKFMLLFVFISIFVFSTSINDMLYLPYWFLIIFLSKKFEENSVLNSKYSA